MSRILSSLLFSVFAASVAHAADMDGLIRGCNGCHGENGVSAGGAMPSIGGQPEAYLSNILTEWNKADRQAGTMNRHAKGYKPEEIAALAKFYSAKPWAPVAQTGSADLIAKGKAIASEKCADCHGDTGKSDDAKTPNLNGQSATYMELELMKYRDDGFKMTNAKMKKNARKLSEADLEAVTKFFASQSK